MNVFEGSLDASGLSFSIIVSRFNSFITEPLVSGAVDAIKRHGADESKIDLIKVPGAFEIPAVAGRVVASGKTDAVICLGAVIRGSTPHFDYVAAEVSKGVASIAAGAKIPVVFGVLTTDTIEQAVERAGTKMGNKGYEAAASAIEMANLFKSM